MSDMNDFERELEYELHRILDPMTARPIPARRATNSGGRMKKLLGGAGAALGVKIATGFAIVAMAATAAGAATEVAITGSVNPSDWGQQVKKQVATCKETLRPAQHGIGECVSQFANQHGKKVSEEHKSSTAPENGNGSGNGNANGHSKANHGQSPSKSPNPQPATSADSEPTDQPSAMAVSSIPPQP